MTTTVLGGRYELRQKLGSGGMATVYEAHDGLLDRAVAVKLLRSDALSEGTARQRFAAEARAAASLTHPYAVAVYDVNSAAEQPFIVMELVRGRTLEDVIADNGAFDEAQVVAVGSQVLAALHAAHLRGLVHRDVKPANILLPGGVVPFKPEQLPGAKLADFGIAKATADAASGLTRMGQVIGTPRYLSPEQVGGERATPKSDLYSTAVVLYEMLAGRAPFERESALGLALAHRDEQPSPLSEFRPDVSPALAAVVHRALSKNPDERYGDAEEMRNALIAATNGTTPATILLGAAPVGTQLARPTGAGGGNGASEATAPTIAPTGAPEVTEPRPGTPRRRLWLLASLVTLVVVGTAAAVWLATRADTPEQPSVPAGAEQNTAEPSEERGQRQGAPPEETEADQQEAVPPPAQDEPEQDEPADEQQEAQPTEAPATEEPPEEEPAQEEPQGNPNPQPEDPPDEDPPDEGPPPQAEEPPPSE